MRILIRGVEVSKTPQRLAFSLDCKNIPGPGCINDKLLRHLPFEDCNCLPSRAMHGDNIIWINSLNVCNGILDFWHRSTDQMESFSQSA